MFEFGKKKEKAASVCACNGTVPVYEAESTAHKCCKSCKPVIESVKVLGSGCKSCHILFENTRTALKGINIDIKAEYVTDVKSIAAYGVMSTPALVVNEQVISMGRVLSAADVEKLLRKQGY